MMRERTGRVLAASEFENENDRLVEREAVREHYKQTACSVTSGCCITNESAVYDPAKLADLPLDAIRASRGCADPHAFANFQPGETVLDLGSGGGIDCLLAAREVGESGSVIGLDMTDEMLELAEKNRAEAGFDNVRFVKGYLEDIPLPDDNVDVVISNCVINLCPDKTAVLSEAARVLKPGGRFIVADIVMTRHVSDDNRAKMSRFLGCGTVIHEEGQYRAALEAAGFFHVSIQAHNAYTRGMLQARAWSKGTHELLDSMDIDEVDGAFAGALVVAWMPR
jgi:arsenite methyltransferase